MPSNGAVAAVIKFIQTLISKIKDAVTEGRNRIVTRRECGNEYVYVKSNDPPEDDNTFPLTIPDTIHDTISEYKAPCAVITATIKGVQSVIREVRDSPLDYTTIRNAGDAVADNINDMISASPVDAIPRRDWIIQKRDKVRSEYDAFITNAQVILMQMLTATREMGKLVKTHRSVLTLPELSLSKLLQVQTSVVKYVTAYSKSLTSELNKVSKAVEPYVPYVAYL